MADKEEKLSVKVMKYFEKFFSEDEVKSMYKCNIENCGKRLCGKYPTNLVKHARRIHDKFIQTEIQEKKKT